MAFSDSRSQLIDLNPKPAQWYHRVGIYRGATNRRAMIHSDLIEIVESIHEQCEPFNEIDRSLFGNDQESQLREIISQQTDHLPDPQAERIFLEFFGWGPIEPLLDRQDLFEIMICGSNSIWFETGDGKFPLDDHFFSDQTFRNFIARLCQESNMILSAAKPFGNGFFKSFRVHVASPPITRSATVTLRRHRKDVISMEQLNQQGVVSDHQMQVLEAMIQEKSNFIVIGATGSGKTTLLNTLIHKVPESERVVIIEDTSELIVPNSVSVKMLTRDSQTDKLPSYYQEHLVKQTLRMRPDRIVVGEVRGGEAKDLLMALATGHEGSMGTLHANSAQQALLRMEMLIQMGAPQWDINTVRRLIQMSLSHIIVLENNKQQRSIEGIYRLASLEKMGFLLNKMA